MTLKMVLAELLALLLTAGLQAQAEQIHLPEITVVGESQGTSNFESAGPRVSELTGARLRRKQQSTLGETLSRELGVSSSSFGPGASRPIVRGLDGDRVRILENGMSVLDASSASPDHAVALDPLTVDKIEMIRGPSALLYGSSVIGGVINSITPRIPQMQFENENGRIEIRGSTVDRGRSAGLVYGGNMGSHFAYHVDGTLRGADNYRIPEGEVLNSFQRNAQGAVGGSYIFADGFAGLAISNFESTYGSIAERDVVLKMRRQRFDSDIGIRTSGFFQSVRFKNSYSVYRHDEVESNVVGTMFKNQGNEARLELVQTDAGPWTGQLGAQSNIFRFEALGDEAFLPPTQNQIHSVFAYEELALGAWTPSLGLRFDHSEVQSESSVKFGGGRGVTADAVSGALGLKHALNSATQVELNLSYTERAPNYQELFAGGVHAATGEYIVGNAAVGKETSRGIEVSLRHKREWGSGRLNLFAQDFGNFVALVPTGATDPTSTFPILNYQGVPARLYGGEFEMLFPLPALFSRGTWQLEAKLDFVKSRDLLHKTSLPRMPALRETLALLYTADRFQADLEVQRSERQDDLAPFERPTNDFILVNLGVDVPVRFSNSLFQVFARANNIFDSEARVSTSPLKDRAPLPGRNLVAGLRAEF